MQLPNVGLQIEPSGFELDYSIFSPFIAFFFNHWAGRKNQERAACEHKSRSAMARPVLHFFQIVNKIFKVVFSLRMHII